MRFLLITTVQFCKYVIIYRLEKMPVNPQSFSWSRSMPKVSKASICLVFRFKESDYVKVFVMFFLNREFFSCFVSNA